jgi:nucleotide-binding universal stress UspA family protein
MSWFPKNKVLVPVDFSSASFDAVRMAQTLVKEASGLHVLHILEPISELSPGVAWGDVTDQTREHHSLEELNRQLSDLKPKGVSIKLAHGSPGLEIARYAEENGIDLIVIPSHGYRGVKHLLLGSVAERVVRHAPCPVLILRRETYKSRKDHSQQPVSLAK